MHGLMSARCRQDRQQIPCPASTCRPLAVERFEDRRLPRHSHGSSFTSRAELEASCRHHRTPFLDTATWTPRPGESASEQTSSQLDFLSRSRVDSFIHEREKSEKRVYKVFARRRRGKREAGSWESANAPAAERRVSLLPCISSRTSVYFRRRLTLDTEPG